MLSFFKSLISAILTFVISITPFAETPEQKCSPEFNGTFLQSWLSSTWSDEQWQKEIENMQNAGVKYLILQDVANKAYEASGGGWTVYYETELAAFADAQRYPDVIEAALRNCTGTDIKVFVGLAMFDDFWTQGALTNQYSEMCSIAADMTEEIYNKYYSKYKENFYGWYFTPEFNNVLTCQINIGGMADGLNKILDRITVLNPSLPLLLSPFYAEYLSAGPLTTLTNLVRLFDKVNFRDGDIFAPQDAVGALWTSEKNLERNWKMYAAAVKTANADVKLWANCENFSLAFADTALDGIFTRPATENTQVITSTLDRFIWQMEVASRYAENIITFSYNHYFSPEAVESFYIETYLDYVKNGYVLESVAPSAVPDFTKTETDGGIELTWNESGDNFGIAYYRITKNGEFLGRVEMCYGSTNLSLADADGKAEDVYEIIACDAAGNMSAAVAAK